MLYVQDRMNHTLAVLENYYNDTHTLILESGVSTYNFTIPKNQDGSEYLVRGNYVVLADDKGQGWKFTIMATDETHSSLDVECEDLGLELLNKVRNSWASPGGAQPFKFYFDKAVRDTGWTLGVNEISNLSRTLSWDGRDTALKRLLSICTQFDHAEIEFKVEFKNMQVTKQAVNVYKQRGANRSDVQLVYGDTVNDIRKTTEIRELATAIQGVGGVIQKDNPVEGEPEEHVDFASLTYDDGEYFTPAGDPFLYARVANQQFNIKDTYLEDFYDYDTQDAQELLNRTLTQLKERCQPKVNYEVDLAKVDSSLNLGDTVTIIDHDYKPELLLSGRVLQLEKSYTDSSKNKATFGNFLILYSNISDQLRALQDQMNSLKPVANYMWLRYAKDDKGTGMTSTPTADTKYVAMLVNKPTSVPSDDPADYAGHWQLIQGTGPEGIPGPKGDDGKTSYTHFAYANNVSGTADFSLDDPTGRSYMGVYSDFTKADSNNPSDYVWSYTKGETGPEGMQGAQGPKGNAGIPGKPGVDGKTPYTHVAYADNDKGDGFSQTPANKPYMGWYTDFTQADSTDTTKYAWSLIKGADGLDGAQGIAGPKGADGKTPYFHSAWANSTDGKTGFNTTDSVNKSYLGTYTDFTVADSADPTKYAWSLIKGRDGLDGKDGIPGKPGADGKTPYFHTAWADSANGKINFSLTDATNRGYLGTYTDFTQADSTDTTKYAWSLIKGRDGLDGAPGKPGSDGKTPYFHQAWADSKDGKINFSLTDPTNRGYLGTYSDFTQADSTDPSKYYWTELVGALVIGGRNYLLDTGTPWQAKGSGGANQASSLKWLFTFGTIKQAPFNDEDYVTVSFDYINVGTGAYGTILPQFNHAPWGQIGGADAMKDNGHVVRTVQWKSGWATSGTATGIQIRVDNVATTRTVTVYNMQFESGNKATDHKVAPEDTQGQIDKVNDAVVKVDNKIAAVPKVTTSKTAPTNPNKGDQWWVIAPDPVTGENGINVFKQWDGSTWAEIPITQSLLVIKELDAVNVNGSTINGSEFTNNFDYTGPDKNHFQGVTQIKDGAVNITWKIPENNQTGNTSLNASGLESIVRDTEGTIIRSARLQMGELQLGDGKVSGWLNEQDVYQNYTNQVQYLDGWSGWNNPISITRRGKMVTFSGYIAHNGGSAHVNIAQFPAWARPEHNEFIVEIHFAGDTGTKTNGYGNLMLSTSGRLIVNRGLDTGQHASFGYTFVGQDI
ncbi:phage tail spike protein [Latilactobacillus sakei]|uniref:phage tail spike protein n=1 Tax=Latilactobacillus sakei TaxID=1599 RepID=UPI00388A9B25